MPDNNVGKKLWTPQQDVEDAKQLLESIKERIESGEINLENSVGWKKIKREPLTEEEIAKIQRFLADLVCEDDPLGLEGPDKPFEGLGAIIATAEREPLVVVTDPQQLHIPGGGRREEPALVAKTIAQGWIRGCNALNEDGEPVAVVTEKVVHRPFCPPPEKSDPIGDS